MIWGQEYLLKRLQPEQKDKVQLYDIYKDPEENNNTANEFIEIVKNLQVMTATAKLATYPTLQYVEGGLHLKPFIYLIIVITLNFFSSPSGCPAGSVGRSCHLCVPAPTLPVPALVPARRLPAHRSALSHAAPAERLADGDQVRAAVAHPRLVPGLPDPERDVLGRGVPLRRSGSLIQPPPR